MPSQPLDPGQAAGTTKLSAPGGFTATWQPQRVVPHNAHGVNVHDPLLSPLGPDPALGQGGGRLLTDNDHSSPADVFHDLMPGEYLLVVVEQMNKYLEMPTSLDELYLVFMAMLHMGIHSSYSLAEFWSKEMPEPLRLSTVCGLSRDRYTALLNAFELGLALHPAEESERDPRDPFRQLRPFFNAWNRNMKEQQVRRRRDNRDLDVDGHAGLRAHPWQAPRRRLPPLLR